MARLKQLPAAAKRPSLKYAVPRSLRDSAVSLDTGGRGANPEVSRFTSASAAALTMMSGTVHDGQSSDRDEGACNQPVADSVSSTPRVNLLHDRSAARPPLQRSSSREDALTARRRSSLVDRPGREVRLGLSKQPPPSSQCMPAALPAEAMVSAEVAPRPSASADDQSRPGRRRSAPSLPMRRVSQSSEIAAVLGSARRRRANSVVQC